VPLGGNYTERTKVEKHLTAEDAEGTEKFDFQMPIAD
jgi:hypothetical protein